MNGIPLTYDPNGNLTQAGPRSLVCNADNLPVQITLGSLTTSFTYDGSGERLKKTSTQGTSLYPFGDDLEITNVGVTKYISVGGQGVLAKRVGPGAGAVTYWMHADRLGSIQAVTNATGTAVHRRTYRPFGETLAQGGSHAESRGWIDQRNDPETGLTYLHARYFDPQLGTFLSPDPIGVEGGLNEYAYAGGDPVNWADRSGLLAGDQVVMIGPKDWDASPGYETYLGVNPLTVAGSAGTGGSLLWFLIERLFFAGPGSGGAGGSGSTTGNPPPGPEDLFQPRFGRAWDLPQPDPPTAEPPPPPPPGGGGGGGATRHPGASAAWGNGTWWNDYSAQLFNEREAQRLRWEYALRTGDWSDIEVAEAGMPTIGSVFKHPWIQRTLFRNLQRLVGKGDAGKFQAALRKGIVGPTGESGIKILRTPVRGFTHELKIGGSGQRLLGRVNEHGVLVFEELARGGLH